VVVVVLMVLVLMVLMVTRAAAVVVCERHGLALVGSVVLLDSRCRKCTAREAGHPSVRPGWSA
jgi:hypothetical protein